jgi:lysozyme family protein
MDFATALAHLLEEEGGFVHHVDDPGGCTKDGVTERTYHHWLRTHGRALRSVRKMTSEERDEIYRTEYWQRAHCEDAPPLLRLALFDAAVNCGVTRAVKWAQAAAGTIADGAVGPNTRAAWRNSDAWRLLEDFLAARRRHHATIVVTNPALRTFLPGWALRCERVRVTCLALQVVA